MAIEASTPLPTPDGWTLASSLRPGDLLFKPRGGALAVGSVQAYIPQACYRVTFNDGTYLVGDKHACLMLQDRRWRTRQQAWFRTKDSKFAKKKFRRALKPKTFAELYKGPLVDDRGRKVWSLQAVSPLEYPTVDLPVPPYVLGLWLGSVTKTGKHWLGDKDFNKMQRKVRAVGFSLSRKKKGDWLFSFRPGVRDAFTFAGAPIPDQIPQSYLEADTASRQALLDGLFDAQDARIVKYPKDNYVISDSWTSARRKQQLLESLGYVTKLTKKERDTNYRLFFPKMSENIDKCRRYVTKVEKITPSQCIHVAAEGEFVAGEGFLAVC